MKRNIKCPRCDRKFKDDHGVKQHLKDIHDIGERPKREERYPLDFSDIEGEYEPRQFRAGLFEDDY